MLNTLNWYIYIARYLFLWNVLFEIQVVVSNALDIIQLSWESLDEGIKMNLFQWLFAKKTNLNHSVFLNGRLLSYLYGVKRWKKRNRLFGVLPRNSRHAKDICGFSVDFNWNMTIRFCIARQEFSMLNHKKRHLRECSWNLKSLKVRQKIRIQHNVFFFFFRCITSAYL